MLLENSAFPVIKVANRGFFSPRRVIFPASKQGSLSPAPPAKTNLGTLTS